MSDRSRVDAVASGATYVVVSVNDRPPEVLADFVGDPTVTMTVASDSQTVTVKGSASLVDDGAVVYEKDRGGVGKDVRTWHVRQRDGRFEAAERSIY